MAIRILFQFGQSYKIKEPRVLQTTRQELMHDPTPVERHSGLYMIFTQLQREVTVYIGQADSLASREGGRLRVLNEYGLTEEDVSRVTVTAVHVWGSTKDPVNETPDWQHVELTDGKATSPAGAPWIDWNMEHLLMRLVKKIWSHRLRNIGLASQEFKNTSNDIVLLSADRKVQEDLIGYLTTQPTYTDNQGFSYWVLGPGAKI